jgi:hypothetical protein
MSLARITNPLALLRTNAPAAVLALAFATVGCGSSTPTQPPQISIGSITVNNGSQLVERGYHLALTATVRDKAGAVVAIPVAWRSLNENIATIDVNGRLAALDTGNATVYASALGVNSSPIGIRVVYQGPAAIATFNFTPPTAASPGAIADSLRVFVTDLNGRPVTSARVAFAVTGGGGTISPPIATTNQFGVASAQWTLGSAFGANTATATVLGEDDKPFSFVSPNVVSFSIKTFAALAPVAGDAQTGLILSSLPINPSVKVVDSTGKPRPGIPVTFTPTANGRVAVTTVSTGADGIASPGAWTLGDLPGPQALIATLDKATITLRATATGTPVHFQPQQLALASFSTCAILTDKTVQCFGAQPNVGDGTTVNRFVPTAASTTAHFTSIAGSQTNPSHFCAVADDQGIFCWGTQAMADTTGKVTNFSVPTRVPSAPAWTQVAPGVAHNCALATDQNVYCWGDNTQGQLADRTLKTNFAPTAISGGFKFGSVTSGSVHSCALALDGSAYCWGNNSSGQLGNGTTTGAVTPTAVSGGIAFTSIGAGTSWTCGLTSAGRVYCWGNLGTGSTSVTAPRTYTAAPNFTSLTVGGAHACGLTSDGTAYCWGNNSGGQVGDSTQVERLSPTPVVTTLKFKNVRAGYLHTCASTSDNSVACWGTNTSGELGDSTLVAGTPVVRVTPRFIVLGVLP